MERWIGRVDLPVGADALRWHQVLRAPAPEAPPGFALLGFCSDEGVRRNQGRPGAADGPAAIRRQLASLPVHHRRPLYDAGDVPCTNGDLETAQATFGARVARLLDGGHMPIGLGGGHEIAFASYLGLARHARGKRLAIVNFDAHLDIRADATASSGTPFRQAIEHARQHGIALDYFCLGASRSGNTKRLFEAADSLGVVYRRDEALGSGELKVRCDELREWLTPADMVYVSICLDVLPQSVAPGVSAPSARGVSMDVVEPLLSCIAATGKIRLLDVAELSPPHDAADMTARVAARLIHHACGEIDSSHDASASLDVG